MAAYVAVTFLAASIVSVQVGVLTVQSPVQPLNELPASAVAVNVTVLLAAKVAEHVAPQLIPAGLLVTVPDPVPALATATEVWPMTLKVAVTSFAADMTTEHGVVAPVQAPAQPTNTLPGEGVAVSETVELVAKNAEHVAPQLMPDGELETVPAPVPAPVTVSSLVETPVGNTTESIHAASLPAN